MFLPIFSILIWSFIGNADCHGNMVIPNSWFDEYGYTGMKAGDQCNMGLELEGGLPGWSCMWFNNETYIPGSPTLDESMRTHNNYIGDYGEEYDWSKRNPWRSPGSAPIFSPCGVAGGNPNGCPVGAPRGEGEDCWGGGFSYGPYAEKFNFRNVPVTEWRAGSIVEAAWGLTANHGGGYSYRLCRTPTDGVSGVTEQCFQSTPLKFHGDNQWVQYGEDRDSRIEFRANRTTRGTTPPGSQWTKNPIPACDDMYGGYYSDTDTCPEGTQFPPPAPGLFGYGGLANSREKATFFFSIGDYLEVPENINPGDYVLSFRWDCEESAQVWSTCANIKILPKSP